MAAQPARPKIGEPFNPWRRFHGSWIPEPMSRYPGLPPGAKLVYGRLLRYAGEDGQCWPAVPNLAAEVGLGERQVQNHMNALETQGFIRRIKRFLGGAQQTNDHKFLWHEIFDQWASEQQAKQGVKDNSPSQVQPNSPDRVKDNSHKESHMKRVKGGARSGMNGYSPQENQEAGELNPVHSGSPKESHGDAGINLSDSSFYTSPRQRAAEERKRRLKAARESL